MLNTTCGCPTPRVGVHHHKSVTNPPTQSTSGTSGESPRPYREGHAALASFDGCTGDEAAALSSPPAPALFSFLFFCLSAFLSFCLSSPRFFSFPFLSFFSFFLPVSTVHHQRCIIPRCLDHQRCRIVAICIGDTCRIAPCRDLAVESLPALTIAVESLLSAVTIAVEALLSAFTIAVESPLPSPSL